MDNIYGELSLWEQPKFPEGPIWRNGLLNKEDGGVVSENDLFWEGDIAEGESSGNILLASSSVKLDFFNEEFFLADWLQNRIDVADIDEIVNSPEFDAILSENIEDSSEVPNDINLLQRLIPAKSFDGFMDLEPILHSKSVSTKETKPEESVYIRNDAENALFEIKLGSPSAYSPISISHCNESVSTFSSTNSSSMPFSDDAAKPDDLICNFKDFKNGKHLPLQKSYLLNKQIDFQISTSGSKLAFKDSKIKKRCQNKTAATRYRNKKKLEFGFLRETERSLLGKNKELINNTFKLETEISYLKGLMKDILVAKGLLKKSE